MALRISVSDFDDGALRAWEPSRAGAARFWSAITSTILRPRCVTRLLPIWPGPRMPLNTRDGVGGCADLEPGARTLCEPCETGLRLKRWRLTVPCEALALRDAGDLHGLALLHHTVDGQLLGRPRAPSPSPRTRAARSGGVARLLEVTEPVPSWSLLLGHVGVAELHGVVAVALGGCAGPVTRHGPAWHRR